ncbi:hypothetical protein CK910_08510 [Aeromonas sp. CA23]|nr:hypothetical protein CK910_08510 [Aeromonas sp. CA23]
MSISASREDCPSTKMRTGRSLLPEMKGFIGMKFHFFMHVERWVRSAPWRVPSGFYKVVVIAIDSKFPRNRKLIARMLGITVEGVKKQVHRAQGNAKKQVIASHIAASLPDTKHDSLRILQAFLLLEG